MRLAGAMAITCAVCVLAGCGSSDRDDVAAKVKQLASATAGRDYKMLCSQVLAPSLVEHLTSNGISCVQALQVALGQVQNPTISIGQITVRGNDASVITLSTAANQQAALETIQLVKTKAGWRITSLGTTVS